MCLCAWWPFVGGQNSRTPFSHTHCSIVPISARCRRLIKGGGVYINNVKVGEELAVVAPEQLIDGRLLLLAAGKKNKMLVRVSDE